MSLSRVDRDLIELERRRTGDALVCAPLVAAWDQLHEAAQVPGAHTDGARWPEAFRDRVLSTMRFVHAHVRAAEAPDSWLARAGRGRRRSTNEAAAEAREHRRLIADLQDLAADARTALATGGTAVALSERAVMLEIDIARHLNRLRAVLESERAPRVVRPTVRPAPRTLLPGL